MERKIIEVSEGVLQRNKRYLALVLNEWEKDIRNTFPQGLGYSLSLDLKLRNTMCGCSVEFKDINKYPMRMVQSTKDANEVILCYDLRNIRVVPDKVMYGDSYLAYNKWDSFVGFFYETEAKGKGTYERLGDYKDKASADGKSLWYSRGKGSTWWDTHSTGNEYKKYEEQFDKVFRELSSVDTVVKIDTTAIKDVSDKTLLPLFRFNMKNHTASMYNYKRQKMRVELVRDGLSDLLFFRVDSRSYNVSDFPYHAYRTSEVLDFSDEFRNVVLKHELG